MAWWEDATSKFGVINGGLWARATVDGYYDYDGLRRDYSTWPQESYSDL